MAVETTTFLLAAYLCCVALHLNTEVVSLPSMSLWRTLHRESLLNSHFNRTISTPACLSSTSQQFRQVAHDGSHRKREGNRCETYWNKQ